MKLSKEELFILKDIIDEELEKYRVKDVSGISCCTYNYNDRVDRLFGLHYKTCNALNKIMRKEKNAQRLYI